jgi:hypothetical protein
MKHVFQTIWYCQLNSIRFVAQRFSPQYLHFMAVQYYISGL